VVHRRSGRPVEAQRSPPGPRWCCRPWARPGWSGPRRSRVATVTGSGGGLGPGGRCSWPSPPANCAVEVLGATFTLVLPGPTLCPFSLVWVWARLHQLGKMNRAGLSSPLTSPLTLGRAICSSPLVRGVGTQRKSPAGRGGVGDSTLVRSAFASAQLVSAEQLQHALRSLVSPAREQGRAGLAQDGARGVKFDHLGTPFGVTDPASRRPDKVSSRPRRLRLLMLVCSNQTGSGSHPTPPPTQAVDVLRKEEKGRDGRREPVVLFGGCPGRGWSPRPDRGVEPT